MRRERAPALRYSFHRSAVPLPRGGRLSRKPHVEKRNLQNRTSASSHRVQRRRQISLRHSPGEGKSAPPQVVGTTWYCVSESFCGIIYTTYSIPNFSYARRMSSFALAKRLGTSCHPRNSLLSDSSQAKSQSRAITSFICPSRDVLV